MTGNHSVPAHQSAEPVPRRQYIPADPCAMVTFGATVDLTLRRAARDGQYWRRLGGTEAGTS